MDTDHTSGLFDDNDLHDVFNKMPDEDFDLLTGTTRMCLKTFKMMVKALTFLRHSFQARF